MIREETVLVARCDRPRCERVLVNRPGDPAKDFDCLLTSLGWERVGDGPAAKWFCVRHRPTPLRPMAD
jgi:hypothetical protein